LKDKPHFLIHNLAAIKYFLIFDLCFSWRPG